VKALFLACCLLGGHPCPADETSGPDRSTIQSFPWGSVYYELSGPGPQRLSSTGNGFRFSSGLGEVGIETLDLNSYRLTCGADFLTISQDDSGLDIHSLDQSWTLRAQEGQCILSSTHPRDTLVFRRNSGKFTINGAKGRVTVGGSAETLSILSPLGRTTVIQRGSRRSIAGAAIEQIPYLGRGLYIPFHGVGVLIDVAKLFPMPEVAEWAGWKPIL
jgi:hypothetical protein